MKYKKVNSFSLNESELEENSSMKKFFDNWKMMYEKSKNDTSPKIINIVQNPVDNSKVTEFTIYHNEDGTTDIEFKYKRKKIKLINCGILNTECENCINGSDHDNHSITLQMYYETIL